MNKAIVNERIKLRANFLNTLGVAFLVTGLVAPLIAYIEGTTSVRDWAAILIVGLICSLFSLVLHLAGDSLLGGLKE